jgi:hypothetical protein
MRGGGNHQIVQIVNNQHGKHQTINKFVDVPLEIGERVNWRRAEIAVVSLMLTPINK